MIFAGLFTESSSFPSVYTFATDVVSLKSRFFESCYRKIEVVRVYDDRPGVELLRTLEPYSLQGPGIDFNTWDGRAEDGTLLPPGLYGIRVTALDLTFTTATSAATSWVLVACWDSSLSSGISSMK